MRAFDTGFQVDGKPLLAPDAGVELGFADLDAADAGRDESGVMHRILVREKVRTFSFSYGYLTGEELRYLQGLFAGKATFTFRFQDTDGKTVTCKAYCADYGVSFASRKLDMYRDMQFTVIEC